MRNGHERHGQPDRHPWHTLLKNGREIGQQDGDPKRHGDVDVSGQFRVITRPEGPQDEVEFRSRTGQRNGHHDHADEHHGGALHDFLPQVRAGRIVALHGDDEHHQREGAPCAVDGRIVVEHLVDDRDHTGSDGNDHEIEGSVGPKCHLHGHKTDQHDGKAEFPAHNAVRPANPWPHTGQEDRHGCVGCDTPSKAGVPTVPAQQHVVAKGQQQARDGLGVNAVGVGRPIRFRVGAGLPEPIKLHRSGSVTHQETGSPKRSNRREKEGNSKEIIVNIMQAVPVLLALEFNQHNRDSKRCQAADKEHQEILVGGFLVEGHLEHTAPNGQETNAHHDDLSEFHQKHVVLAHFCIGPDHGDASPFGGAPRNDATGKGGAAGCGFHRYRGGFSPWCCHANQ